MGGVQGQPHTNRSQPGPSVSLCPGRHLTPGERMAVWWGGCELSGQTCGQWSAHGGGRGLLLCSGRLCSLSPGGPTARLCPLLGHSLPTSQPGSAKSLLSRALSAGEEGRKSVGGQGRGNCSGRKEVPTSQGCMCRCKGRWAGSKAPV